MKGFKYESSGYTLKYMDDIFHLTYKKGPITLEVAKEMVKKRLELTNNEPVLVVVDDVGLKSVDREARNYFSTDDGVKGIIASAFVVRSSFGKYMANFFIKVSVSKPIFPARVFSNKEDAIVWLRQFKK